MTDKAGIKEDVDRLKEWYSKQRHLPQNIDEYYFYNFVCGTNSLEKAKRKIDAYFSLRTKCMDMLTGVYPHTEVYRNLLKAHHSGVMDTKTPEGYRVMDTKTPEGYRVMDTKTPEGYRVMFGSAIQADPSFYHADAYFLRLLCMVEIAFEKWPTDMDYIGFSIYDSIPLSALKTLNIKHAIALARLLSEGLPMKLKAHYIMNVPAFLVKFEPLLRSLVSKKLNERFIVCQDSLLKEFLPASMIPAEFGGKGQSLKEISDFWTELMDSRTGSFEEKLKLRTDESKRGKDCAWKGDLDFGIEGSFKTLNID